MAEILFLKISLKTNKKTSVLKDLGIKIACQPLIPQI